MKQKIEDIKAFIKYYSRLNIEVTSIELEDDIDTFLVQVILMFTIQSMNILMI